MSDLTPLRQAVDTLADRAPSPDFGELKSRATRRGRRRKTLVAAAAVAVIAGSAVASVGLGNEAPTTPLEQPRDELPPSPGGERSTGPLPPISPERFEVEVDAALAKAADWVILDSSPWLLPGACDGEWAEGSGFGGGDFSVPSFGGSASVWADRHYYPSSGQAAAAVAGVPNHFAPCADVWQTAPIPQTGAVLAYSAGGVIFFQQQGRGVATLQIPTADGPPPADVQTEIADLLGAYIRHD